MVLRPRTDGDPQRSVLLHIGDVAFRQEEDWLQVRLPNSADAIDFSPSITGFELSWPRAFFNRTAYRGVTVEQPVVDLVRGQEGRGAHRGDRDRGLDRAAGEHGGRVASGAAICPTCRPPSPTTGITRGRCCSPRTRARRHRPCTCSSPGCCSPSIRRPGPALQVRRAASAHLVSPGCRVPRPVAAPPDGRSGHVSKHVLQNIRDMF